jgi:hypothetical protein
MKEKKPIRYRLGVSLEFPKSHARKGELTDFVDSIACVKFCPGDCEFCDFEKEKIHTIRSNYPLWEKRMKKVQAGEAVIEMFYWSGKPYNSKQVVFAMLDNDSGCGVQKLEWWGTGSMFVAWTETEDQDFYSELKLETLAKNDGLSLDDFKEWFKVYDLSQPMAIIHFTKFRY